MGGFRQDGFISAVGAASRRTRKAWYEHLIFDQDGGYKSAKFLLFEHDELFLDFLEIIIGLLGRSAVKETE